ncbi:MAG: hypothetical protein JSV86_17165 [Gemmatimonadota bacterium]|nr:MAG: hypothetical protein JSV86_17165 [Gemmatimonadota bacterium]
MPLYHSRQLPWIGIDAQSGSVIYGKLGGGGLEQDNADFFWDRAAKRLDIGTTSGGAMHIGDAGAGSTTSYGQFNAGSTTAVSPANTGRLRYNEVLQQFEVSHNGLAYVPLGIAGAPGTLDQAYDSGGPGAGRTIQADAGAVVFTSSAADNNNILELVKTPAGPQGGNGLYVLMTSTASGAGVNVTDTGTYATIAWNTSTESAYVELEEASGELWIVADDGVRATNGGALGTYLHMTADQHDIVQLGSLAGNPIGFRYTGGSNTLSLNNETTDAYFNLNRLVTFPGGPATSITTQRAIRVAAPTYDASAATLTIDDAYTFDVSGAPADGGVNIVLTRAWAAGFGADAEFRGEIAQKGSVSGWLRHAVPGTVTSYTITWPSAQAVGSQVLTNDGAGNLSWTTNAAVGNTLDQAYDQGGAGAGRSITADAGAVVITNSAADNNNVLELNKTPAGAQSGNGIEIQMGSNATGRAVYAYTDYINAASQSVIEAELSTEHTAAPTANTYAGIRSNTALGNGNNQNLTATVGISAFRATHNNPIGPTGTVTGLAYYEIGQSLLSGATYTNQYGFYSPALTGATNNYVAHLGADTDAQAIIGRARFDSRTTDEAFFSHFDNTATGAYAIKQIASGHTSVNAASGRVIYLRINNSAQFNVSTADGFYATNANGPALDNIAAGATTPTFLPDRASTTTGIGSAGANQISFVVSGAEHSRIDSTALTLYDGVDLIMEGSTSGTLTHSVPATVTTYAVVWPNAQGGASTALVNDGAGNLSWTATSGFGVTLDGAYDFGGAAAGRTINIVDSSPVELYQPSVGATTTDAKVGLHLHNDTAAAAGAQQYSPMVVLEGQGWETDVGSSMEVKWALQVQPIQGAATPSSEFHLLSSINGGAYTSRWSVTGGSGSDITAGADTDTTNIFGRARIDARSTDWAHFSHYDMNGTNQYAVRQTPTGVTNLNSATGQATILSINNSAQFKVDTTNGFYANNANGPAVLNEAPSTTNPVFCPDRTDLTSGIGGGTNTITYALGGAAAGAWTIGAANSSYLTIGTGDASLSGVSRLQLQTDVRTAYIQLDNTTAQMAIVPPTASQSLFVGVAGTPWRVSTQHQVWTQSAQSSTPAVFNVEYTYANHTSLTNAEVTDFYINNTHSVQFDGGAATVGTNRAVRIGQPTYDAAAAGFTITDAITMEIAGEPLDGGANITLTNTYALKVASGLSYLADGIYFDEQASQPKATVPAGAGLLYVKNTAPSGLYFVDDANNYQRLDRLDYASVTTATYAVSLNEQVLLCNRAGAIQVDLPAASSAAGKVYWVKDISGNASGNNITIEPNGAETIDNSSNYVMNIDYQSITCYSDGTEWWII